LYRVDVETGFQLVGFVGHDSQVQRSILEQNRFYSIADDSVMSQQILAKAPLGNGDTTYSIGPSLELRLTDNPRSVVLPPITAGPDRTISGPLVVFKLSDSTGLSATVNWGDGNQSEAAIVPGDDGRFSAVGQHTYAANGNYNVTITFMRDGQILRSDYSYVVVNPIDAHVERFLQRLYQYLLGRNADSAGLESWAASLNNGASRAMIAQLILNSVEYQTRQIQTMYHEWLGRNAENEGLTSWLQFLAAGRSLDDVQAGILSSQEYLDYAGNASDYVGKLYQELLGRQADEAGLVAWTNAMNAGMSRAQIVQLLQRSLEAAIRQITLNYQNILGRAGEEQGLRFFAGALQAGIPGTAAQAIFLGSNEYYEAG
jgi:hypothetical protein